MFECLGLLYLIISSGFTPTNAETQTWPAVTGLAALFAFDSSTIPSTPQDESQVPNTVWFSWQLGWRGGKKLFLSAEDFKSFWLGCVLVGVTFQKYHTIIDVNCSLCRWSKLSRFFPLLCLTGRRSATECCDRWGWTMASGLWDSLSSKREQNEEASSSEIRIKIPHIQIVSTAEVIKVLTYSRHIDRSVFTLTYLT